MTTLKKKKKKTRKQTPTSVGSAPAAAPKTEPKAEPKAELETRTIGQDKAKRIIGIVLVAAMLCLFARVIYQTAWQSDDAYITYRTMDNFVNGHGLRWNANERVQPYTHPLWLFVNMIPYAITREAFATGIAVSAFVTLLALALACFMVARNKTLALLGVTVLLFSRAFVDYATSGLENPLTHLLLALFFVVYLRREWTPRTLFWMSLVAALAALNRMDTILFYVPAVAFALARIGAAGNGGGPESARNGDSPVSLGDSVAWYSPRFLLAWYSPRFLAWHSRRFLPGLGAVALGFVPFVLWELFSVFYYGFPFPNTAYAKLGTGIPAGELMAQGWHYFAHTFSRDPLTLPVTLLGVAAALFLRKDRLAPLGIGVLLYLLYVMKIGGDFMGGRFFTAPLFAAVLILTRLPVRGNPLVWAPAFAVAMLISLWQPFAPITTGAKLRINIKPEEAGWLFFSYSKLPSWKDANGIGDERRFWFPVTCLHDWMAGDVTPSHKYADTGRQYRKLDRPITKPHGSVGFRGYFGGPKVHIIDYYALADPLLARLPAKYNANWRIGHFMRPVPRGYAAATGGQLDAFTDEGLGEYYAHLDRIIRGPLFSPGRWWDIVKMNLGAYDSLIDVDKYRFPGQRRVEHARLGKAKKAGTPGNAKGNLVLPGQGVHVSLAETSRAKTIELTVDGNDNYRLLFMKGADELGKATIEAEGRRGGLAQHTVTVPAKAARKGFDAIKVIPFGGDKKYSLGHLALVG